MENGNKAIHCAEHRSLPLFISKESPIRDCIASKMYNAIFKFVFNCANTMMMMKNGQQAHQRHDNKYSKY